MGENLQRPGRAGFLSPSPPPMTARRSKVARKKTPAGILAALAAEPDFIIRGTHSAFLCICIATRPLCWVGRHSSVMSGIPINYTHGAERPSFAVFRSPSLLVRHGPKGRSQDNKYYGGYEWERKRVTPSPPVEPSQAVGSAMPYGVDGPGMTVSLLPRRLPSSRNLAEHTAALRLP